MSPDRVEGDAVLLERLIANLVQNAIRYNFPGGLIHALVTRDAIITVTNTGAVIPPDAIPGFFEPFRRLSVERTQTRGGAGLGLAIVASIVAAHHGQVSDDAVPSGGLAVTVTLPKTQPS